MRAELRSLYHRFAVGFGQMNPSSARNCREEVRLLEEFLWRGRSSQAEPRMASLIDSPDVPENVKTIARSALACWFFHKGDERRALDLLQAGLAADARALERPRFKRALVALHVALGNFADAKKILEKAGSSGTSYDRLLAASAEIDDDDRLSRLNEIFSSNGLSTLERCENEPLTFETLRGSTRPRSIPGTGRVSVIVPVHNRRETLAYSVRSVCDQTYENLEIVIVDDASSDDSLTIANTLAERDSRISIVRHERNLGAYQARNAGLAAASGDFVTVQDSDDWSHPQRIELQMSEFHDGVLAIGSHRVRFSNDLRYATWRLSNGAPMRNYWSVVFRREVFDAIGDWDPTLFGADTDFVRRLEAYGGRGSVRWVKETVPLAFALFSPGSLTASSRTHISTVFNGPRHLNRCLSKYWYETLGKVAPEHQKERVALLPEIFHRKEPRIASASLCLKGDFSKPERVMAAQKYIADATGNVALYNVPDFSVVRDQEFELCPEFFELLQNDRVICVFDFEDVSTGRAVTLS